MGLKRYKLGDLIEVTRGQSLAGEFYAEEGKYIRLTLGNFDYANGGFKPNTSKTNLYYTGPIKEQFILEEGDIITPLTEQTPGLLGSTARIPISGTYIQSQDVALVRCKDGMIDPAFCYYLLPSSSVKKQLAAGAHDISEQRRIGQLLDAITHKIELNRSINQNLEALAKQLYDYWFVQFDFPDEQGKPYKSSGGKMVWNEKLKREIPDGWEAVSVNDISDSYRGVSYAKDDLVDEQHGLLVLRGNNIQNSQLVFDSNVAYIPESFVSDEQKIRKGHIIMTMSSGSKEHVGKCVLFHHEPNETYGAFLTKFVPHAFCSNLLYNVFNSDYFKSIIKSTASGTGINNLTNQTFDNIFIAMPPMELLQKYDALQDQLFGEVGNLQQNTWNLIKQRDELLPFLMNGQVTLE